VVDNTVAASIPQLGSYRGLLIGGGITFK